MPKRDIHGDKISPQDNGDWFERNDLPEKTDITKDDITKGGFYKLDLDLDPSLLTVLVDEWARNHLQAASLEQYIEVFEDTDNQSKALYDAVLNDIIIDILKSKIAEAEAEAESDSADI